MDKKYFILILLLIPMIQAQQEFYMPPNQTGFFDLQLCSHDSISNATLNISSSVYSCYQESVNDSNQNHENGLCDLNFSGRYENEDGNAFINYTSLIDGDWSTYSACDYIDGACSHLVNYSNSSFFDTAFIKFKHGYPPNGDPLNYTIEVNRSCLDREDDLMLRYRNHEGNGFGDTIECYDGSWIQVWNDTISSTTWFYEDSISWNITPVLSFVNLTFNDLEIFNWSVGNINPFNDSQFQNHGIDIGTTAGQTDPFGMLVYFNSSGIVEEVNITTDVLSTYLIMKHQNGTNISQVSISSGIATFGGNATVDNDTHYRFEAGGGGANPRRFSVDAFPVVLEYLTYVGGSANGINDSSWNNIYNINFTAYLDSDVSNHFGSNTTLNFNNSLMAYVTDCPNISGLDCSIPFMFNTTGNGGVILNPNFTYPDCVGNLPSDIPLGGSAVNEFFYDYNRPIYLQIRQSWNDVFDLSQLKDLFPNLWKFFILLLKYSLRQPASLSDLGGLE